ncbi:hypothetical protein cypCar_00036230 [Cyprinus carpio]|nr:hypothetical protein cypCar_00036230 [Cyprinus carpio]
MVILLSSHLRSRAHLLHSARCPGVSQPTLQDAGGEAWINPDLLAIRFASTNAILDPWIYILLLLKRFSQR